MRPTGPSGRTAAGRQSGPEFLPCVVQRLVAGRGGVQPLSQDIDRDIAERDRDQHLALVGGQPGPAVLPQRRDSWRQELVQEAHGVEHVPYGRRK